MAVNNLPRIARYGRKVNYEIKPE